MKYKITIVELTEPDEKGYCRSNDLYEQIVEDLDVQAVVSVVNKLPTGSCCI